VRIAQEAPQDRRAHGERQVRDDAERLIRQPDDGRVTLDHLDSRIVAETGTELAERRRIELDCAHPRPSVRESARQDAAAGAEVEDERSGPDASVADELVCEGAATKGVTAARPRLR
jgi:hypothetical protein